MAKTRLDDAGLVVLGALARESGERFHGNGALGMARFGAGSMVANSRLSISASVATTRKLMTARGQLCQKRAAHMPVKVIEQSMQDLHE
ncbi:MAG: hypothetical protein LAO04_20750 [Acidobacteriia bacterium]|nr:hypothetical protein [Terriglobia bacterium]